MKLNKLSLLLLIISSLVLFGCAPQSTPEVEPAEMEESEMTTEEPVEESATEEMTEETEMTEEAEMTEEVEMLELTAEELKQYNGQDGQPVYVAVDGVIYDVTTLAKWASGLHMGQHEAGQDLSEEILKSPHGKAILERATPIGKLVE